MPCPWAEGSSKKKEEQHLKPYFFLISKLKGRGWKKRERNPHEPPGEGEKISESCRGTGVQRKGRDRKLGSRLK